MWLTACQCLFTLLLVAMVAATLLACVSTVQTWASVQAPQSLPIRRAGICRQVILYPHRTYIAQGMLLPRYILVRTFFMCTRVLVLSDVKIVEMPYESAE